MILRLLGRDVAKPPAIERADALLDAIDVVKITIVPKRDEALRDGFRRAGHRIGGR